MSEHEMVVDRMGLLEAAGMTLTPKNPAEAAEEIPWKVLRPACELAEQVLKRNGYRVLKISPHPIVRFRLTWPERLGKPGFHGGMPRPGEGGKGVVHMSQTILTRR
jgi:hypothetical protein